MTKLPVAADKVRERSREVLSGGEKRASKTPTWDELKRDPIVGPALTIVDTPDGKRNGTINDTTPDRAVMKRFVAMTQERREHDYWVGQNENHKAPQQFETLVAESGRTKQVLAENAEDVARKEGMKPRINWGRPSYRVKYLPDGTRVEYRG